MGTVRVVAESVGDRLIQADQHRATISMITAAAGPKRSYDGRRGGSGVTHGWIGSETGSGSSACDALGACGATDSRPLIRWYIRCRASVGTLAFWPIRLRIWWTLATSARWTSEVRHRFSNSATSSGGSSLSR